MPEKVSRYYRYAEPNKFDTLPCGTEIVVLPNSLYCKAHYYKQVSNDHNNPKWEKMGSNTAPLKDVAVP